MKGQSERLTYLRSLQKLSMAIMHSIHVIIHLIFIELKTRIMDTKFVDFKDTTVYVGIDVHKKQWTVTVLTDQVHHRTFSQPPCLLYTSPSPRDS